METISNNHLITVEQHYSPDVFNEVIYLLKQSNGDADVVMTIFENHQMWEHAMCLDEIQLQK